MRLCASPAVACIRACPGGLITKKDFPVPIENGWDLCIDCGHCVAICPTGAMHQRSMGPEDCEEIDIHLIPRVGSGQTVPDLAAFSSWLHQQAHRKRKDLAAVGCGPLRPKRREPSGDPMGRDQRPGEGSPDGRDDHRVDEGREGKGPGALRGSQAGSVCRSRGTAAQDRISRGAPCIIMACAPKDERTAPPAAMIAIHQIQLAAPGLGLGTTFTGSYQHGRSGLPAAGRDAWAAGRLYSPCYVRDWVSG